MQTKAIDELKKQFNNKKVLVVGLGLQGGGVGLVNFFSSLGALVTVTDLKNEQILTESLAKIPSSVRTVLGKHELMDFLEADIIFKGPSVPWHMPQLLQAQEKRVPVEMESSFMASLCPAPIIGITGTRGKSTVTAMIAGLLPYTNKKFFTGGNIPGSSTIHILKDVEPQDIVLLELSSWQLSGFHKKKFSPHISVYTNLYPDHLNYYKSMEEYSSDKSAIYRYQTSSDYLIASSSLRQEVEKQPPASAVSYINSATFPTELSSISGEHNKQNAGCAYEVGRILHVPQEQLITSIKQFKGLLYRQEIRRTKGNVTFINDSASTTPISTIKAIERFKDKRIILILGGNSKYLPVAELISYLEIPSAIILLKGSFTEELLLSLPDSLKSRLHGPYDILDAAVSQAYVIASKIPEKSYVLFSPGATSFAMFNNEFHRGDEFNTYVSTI